MGFNGLLALADKTTWLFTATLTDYYRDSFKVAFGVDETVFHRFVTPQKLVYNKDVTQRIEVLLKKTPSETKNAFY